MVNEETPPEELKKKNIRLAFILGGIALFIYLGFILKHLVDV